MPRLRHFHSGVGTAVLLALGITLAGCVVEVRDGDTAVFTFATWVPGLVLSFGSVFCLAGLAIRRKSVLWGTGLAIAGLIVLLLLAPGSFLDRSTVSPSRFTLQTGFWFAPTTFDVPFADLSSIEVVAEEETDARGVTSKSRYLVCHHKSGASQKIPLGDLMNAGAKARILERAREQGVPVSDKL
ncbi:MAG: hypothetical protein AB1898_17690 [Acidobacteriota bacterium]